MLVSIAFSGNLDSVSNHHWKTELSRLWSFIHHDNINQPSKPKSEPQCSPETEHTKEYWGGNMFLATVAPRGSLLLTEPDGIRFFGVLKGHCAHQVQKESVL